MANRKPGKPYNGILAVPAPKIDYRLSEHENWLKYKEIVVAKMNALFDHYNQSRTEARKTAGKQKVGFLQIVTTRHRSQGSET